MTTVTAANGQTITLNYSAGKLTSASYVTADGTRTVNYSASAPWQVTYYPNTSLACVVKSRIRDRVETPPVGISDLPRQPGPLVMRSRRHASPTRGPLRSSAPHATAPTAKMPAAHQKAVE